MNDSILTSLPGFNSKILNLKIQFLKDTGRFDKPLIQL